MGTSNVQIYAYSGSLADLGIGGVVGASVLNGITGPTGAAITDDDGSLDSSDSGTATLTIDGTTGPITYVGAGTVSTLSLLGQPVFPHDVSIFTVGGQVYLMLPEGLPPLAQLLVTFNVSPDTPTELPDFVPCFAAGTMLLTPQGERRVEDLVPGDLVTGHDGQIHRLTWVGRRRVVFRDMAAPVAQELHPVVIPPNCFGLGMPVRETRLSPQHRVLVDWPEVELLYGAEEMLAPIGALAGDRIWIDRRCEAVTYCHVMCESHAVLVANGLPAESLLPGPQLRNAMSRAAWTEITRIFPELDQGDMPAVLPILSGRETRLLAMECSLY